MLLLPIAKINYKWQRGLLQSRILFCEKLV
jgi:hypothetical protein